MSDDPRWRRMRMDDPAVVANADQIIAGAHERISKATSFVAITVAKDDVPEVSAVIEPEAVSDDSEQLMRMMAYTLVRMWLDGIEDDDPITAGIMVHQFIQNMTGTITIVLDEKGMM